MFTLNFSIFYKRKSVYASQTVKKKKKTKGKILINSGFHNEVHLVANSICIGATFYDIILIDTLRAVWKIPPGKLPPGNIPPRKSPSWGLGLRLGLGVRVRNPSNPNPSNRNPSNLNPSSPNPRDFFKTRAHFFFCFLLRFNIAYEQN